MTNSEENKSCKNCKYFIQHYVIIGTGFYTAECGRCAARRIKPKETYYFPFKTACELWEADISKKQEQTKNIESAIMQIQKMLSEILQILTIDK